MSRGGTSVAGIVFVADLLKFICARERAVSLSLAG
eukprot:CAMPEP_0195009084 /NCGR_PEP_ID=MMETSP0326_2-20130528/8999_1 /TAXON_ID=2866 ORGANISM="Crypthecodinium cohnii, Strain Seligo" /NCGR_SAMPLE_ID=MMETSP0326_2 /ASSEMBLY_ACC=CAM_ASM_000348 /LENGTH=34 /DNA_ID= /DNA_START= /DNA_END= /DNA_ORIENTATION=